MLVFLALDLGVFHREAHVVSFKEALAWTGLWVTLAMLFGLFWLCWILLTLLDHGLPTLTPVVFTQMTPPPGSAGGLLNAIAGSLMMTVVGTLIGTPIGILAGTYLAEFGQRGWISATQ